MKKYLNWKGNIEGRDEMEGGGWDIISGMVRLVAGLTLSPLYLSQHQEHMVWKTC